MDVVLMNKNVPLLSMDLDIGTSYVKSIERIENKEYFPLGIFDENPELLQKKFTAWWNGRSIPASRNGLKEKLSYLPIDGINELVAKSLGLSLSDQYWIKPKALDKTWDDVNFFTNDFSKDMGEFFIDHQIQQQIDMKSPDNTADGMLPKKWIIENGQRFLLKSGTLPNEQEPFNEKVAAMILGCMDIPYVPYDIVQSKERYYSKCPNFINENLEYVPAFYIFKSMPEEKHCNKEDHLQRCIDRLEIPDTEHFLNQMLALDFIILNTDRHWENFGFLRDVNTLKFLGPAPLFDNGTSLWNNLNFVPLAFDEAKTFRTTHKKQSKLITNFDGIDFSKIYKLEADIQSCFVANRNFEEKKIIRIVQRLQSRVKKLEKLQFKQKQPFVR